jgi:hypothetical protein
MLSGAITPEKTPQGLAIRLSSPEKSINRTLGRLSAPHLDGDGLAVERPQAETRLPEWNKTDYRLISTCPPESEHARKLEQRNCSNQV